MRRLLSAVVAVAIATLVAAPAAPAQAPYGDSVTGEAAVGFGLGGAWGFRIDAHSGPSGEAPTGTIEANNFLFGGFTFSVTCLTVSGNRAAMFGPNASPSGPSMVQITVEDNDGTADDRLGFGLRDFPFPTPGPPPTDCPVGTADLGPLRFGDITVADVPPLPTSKDQCKNGGWRTFGSTFRSQGQCITFVQRGP